MSDVEDAWQQELTSNETISNNLGTRLYPNRTPQDVPSDPYARYERIANTRDETLSGPSGYSTATFHVDIYDTDYKNARTVAEDIRKEYDGRHQTLIGTSKQILVERIKVQNVRNLRVNDETQDRVVRIVVEINYQEPS